jgi:phosphopantothenoylcysteine synthetase/decarboxylase
MRSTKMVTRRDMLAAGFAVVLGAGSAAAQSTVTDQVVAQLRDQGYTVQRMNRTLLGRVRVIARRGDQSREVVFDPRNGVILRDYTTGLFGTSEDDDQSGSSGGQAGGGNGGGDDDDDDDDDDGDDDDDDDDDGDDD